MPDTPQIAFNPKTGQYLALVNGQWAPTHVAVNRTTGERLAWIGGDWVPAGRAAVPATAPATSQPAKSQPGWGEWAARTALKYVPSILLTARGAATGTETGAELGGAVGGPYGAAIGGILGGITGAGLGSGASEYLPKSMGGAKQPSFKRGFAYGAIPEALVPIGSAIVRPLVKTGEAGAAAQKEAIEKAIEESKGMVGEAANSWIEKLGKAAKPVEEAKQNLRSWIEEQIAQRGAKRRLRSLMPTPAETFDPSGRGAEALAQTARTLTQAARAEGGGRALGEAYERLKLPENALVNIEELPDFVQTIRGGLQGPISPRTEKLLQRAQELGSETALDTPVGLEQIGKQASATDVLRLRQEASKALPKALGSDRYALGRLIDKLDDHLESYLPPEIHPLRAQYRGTMRVLPYEVEQKLGKAIHPRDAAQVIFKTPERALAIIGQATNSADRKVLRDGFAQKIFSVVDPSKPINKQLRDIRKALQPWLAKGVTGKSVVEELYGPNAEQEVRNLMNAPMNAVRLSALFANPESRQAALDEMKRTIMNDPQRVKLAGAVKQAVAKLQETAAEATENLAKTTIPATQKLQEAAMKSPHEAAAQAIERQLRGGPGGFLRYLQHRALFGLTEGAIMGYGAGTGKWAIAGLASIPLLWIAAMRAGAAGPLARYLASSTARQAGRNLAQLLVAIGSQTTRQSMEDISEEPVEMPASAAAAGAP
jgi:hypothetical protein